MPRVAYVSLYSEDFTLPGVRVGLRPRSERQAVPNFGEMKVVFLAASSAGATARDRATLQTRLDAVADGLWPTVAAGEYDVIYSDAEDIGLPLATAAAAAGDQRPFLIRVHGFLQRPADALRAAVGRRNVHFLALSKAIADWLVGDWRAAASRIFVAPFSVDTGFFRSLRPGLPDLVVAAGTGDRDYRTLLDACRDAPWRLAVAADSAWYPSPPNLCDAPPTAVRFGSCGDHVRLRALYECATVVVVPLRECQNACGYAVIGEAMAMGRPVIATRTAHPGDYVADGVTGLFVKPGDVEALRSALVRLMENPEVRRTMGVAARRRAQRLFTHEVYWRQLAEVLGALAA